MIYAKAALQNIIKSPRPPTHVGLDTLIQPRLGKAGSREQRTLIGIKYNTTLLLHDVANRLNSEVGIQFFSQTKPNTHQLYLSITAINYQGKRIKNT